MWTAESRTISFHLLSLVLTIAWVNGEHHVEEAEDQFVGPIQRKIRDKIPPCVHDEVLC